MIFIEILKRALNDRSQRRRFVMVDRKALEELMYHFETLDAEHRAGEPAERVVVYTHLRLAVELCYAKSKDKAMEDTLDVVVDTLHKLRQKAKKARDEGRHV